MDNPFMKRAIQLSIDSLQSGRGGPFGAVIVRDSKIVAEGAPSEALVPENLLAAYGRKGRLVAIDGRRVAVEHNLVVLKRDAFGSTTLKEGDEVEIVNFVGGG